MCLMGWEISTIEGKSRKSFSVPPLKILDISTSPTPFSLGHDPLSITVEVELPRNLEDTDILEVSSLIHFPTKSSIRFLSSRQPVAPSLNQPGKPRIQTTLLWDGTDQSNRKVGAGTYHYEIRAKLFSNDYHGPRTKMVSLRAKGVLEVAEPEVIGIPDSEPSPKAEHVPFVSEETAPEELGLEGENLNQEQSSAEEVPDSDVLNPTEEEPPPESPMPTLPGY